MGSISQAAMKRRMWKSDTACRKFSPLNWARYELNAWKSCTNITKMEA